MVDALLYGARGVAAGEGGGGVAGEPHGVALHSSTQARHAKAKGTRGSGVGVCWVVIPSPSLPQPFNPVLPPCSLTPYAPWFWGRNVAAICALTT